MKLWWPRQRTTIICEPDGSGLAATTPAPCEPQFDGGDCVHALLPTAGCRACIEACPRDALVLGDSAIELDTTLCDGCGLCRPACPERVIDIGTPPLMRQSGHHSLTAFSACEKVAARGSAAVMPCLHAIGIRELGDLAAEGVTRLVVASGDCDNCERGTADTLWQAGEDAARLRRSRQQAPVQLERLSPPVWRAELERAGRPRAAVDQSRRAALGFGRAAIEAVRMPPAAFHGWAQEPERFAHVPSIEALKCDGCDACVRICPHYAIGVSTVDGVAAYRVSPVGCTGCSLCRDVCPADAIRIEQISVAPPAIPLRRARCRACGIDFHVPAPRPQSALCPICARKPSGSTLFRVKR